jgi:hypothetical protein
VKAKPGTYAKPGMEPFVLLAFSVQRLARAMQTMPGVDKELLLKADGDAMLVLEASGIALPPLLQAVADARRRERQQGETP